MESSKLIIYLIDMCQSCQGIMILDFGTQLHPMHVCPKFLTNLKFLIKTGISHHIFSDFLEKQITRFWKKKKIEKILPHLPSPSSLIIVFVCLSQLF
jgi:hypothetical protein